LAELEVAEPDISKAFEHAMTATVGFEEVDGVLDGHGEDVRDRLASILDLEGLAVVPQSRTFIARHEDVGKEVHLDATHSLTLARLASPSLDVEAEAPWEVSADLGLRCLREETTDVVEDAGVRGRIRSRRSTDR
jgi:hypothetical protein